MSTTQTIVIVAVVALVLYIMMQAKKVTTTVTQAAGGGSSVWSQLATGAVAGIFQGAVSLISGKGNTNDNAAKSVDRDALLAPSF